MKKKALRGARRRIINEFTHERLGGTHCVNIVIGASDFAEIEEWAHEGRWDLIEQRVVEEGQCLQAAGADFLVLSANTLHKLAEGIEKRLDLPRLNIVGMTCRRIRDRGYTKVALLGTRFTMEDGFYQKISTQHGVEISCTDAIDPLP